MDVKTILVPSDFSEHSTKALDAAIELAKAFGAKVEIVHAFLLQPPMVTMQGGYTIPDHYFEEIRTRAKEEVEKLAQERSGSGVEVTGRAIESPPSSGILEVAEQIKPDLIVMGTRGQTGLKHVLLGSVAERVVRMAECPVMTMKSN
jgi:nucleotide-binding universal stress UspA family protein